MTLTRTTQKVTFDVEKVTIFKDSHNTGIVNISLDTVNADNSHLDTQVFDAVGKITLTFTDENTGETFKYFVNNSLAKPKTLLQNGTPRVSATKNQNTNIKNKIESFIDRHHEYFNMEHSIDDIKTLYEQETGEQLSKSYLGKLITDSGKLHKRRLRNRDYKTKTWYYSNHEHKNARIKHEDINDFVDISDNILSENLEQPLDNDELELLELLSSENGGLMAKKRHRK